MRSSQKYPYITLLVLTLTASMSSSARAHLMVAQRGTLNIVDDGAFMVLSLPLSTFEGVDEDNDGKVSMLEFNHRRAAIVKLLRHNVTLSDKEGRHSLEGIMLSPVVPHDAPKAEISQLIVMGKFTLDNPDDALRFHIGLYGKQATEQVMTITATRKAAKQKHVFKLTPKASAAILFPDSVSSPD